MVFSSSTHTRHARARALTQTHTHTHTHIHTHTRKHTHTHTQKNSDVQRCLEDEPQQARAKRSVTGGLEEMGLESSFTRRSRLESSDGPDKT